MSHGQKRVREYFDWTSSRLHCWKYPLALVNSRRQAGNFHLPGVDD